MNMKARILPLLLSGALLLLCLQGCSPAQAPGATATATVGSTAGAGTQAPAATQSGEIVSLKFLNYDDVFDPTTDYTRQIIRELLGYDIIPEMGIDTDKVNLIISSGQEYDMICLSDRNLMGPYIANRGIQPLSALIDQYGPNLKTAFKSYEWDMVSSGSEIYALPSTSTEDVTTGLVFRQDWLDAMDEDMPENPQELYDLLVKFKTEDPGGAGDMLIPFALSGNSFNGLSQAYGLDQVPYYFVDVDGRLVSGVELPGMEEFLTYLNRLYAEKLINADYPTSPKLVDVVGTGNVACSIFSCWNSAAQRAIAEKNPEAKLVYSGPLKDAQGNQRINSRGGLSQYCVVPSASKKADEVIKYCNAFLDEDKYIKIVLGTEGVSYEVRDGSYYPILPEFDKYNKGRWFNAVNEGRMYTPLFGCRAHKEVEMGEMWDDLNAKSGDNKYVYPVNYAPLLPEIEEYGVRLDAYALETITKMIIDADELAKYDEFVTKWKADGGDALTTALNEWYQNR